MVEVRNFLRRIINARYSVSSWLWIIVSTFAAVIMLLQLMGGSPEAVEFLSNLPLNGYLWTGGLILTGLFKMFGMAFHKDWAVSWGSFVAFCLWVFGMITFIILGNAVTVVLLIAPIMVFNAYLFLGATLRERPQA